MCDAFIILMRVLSFTDIAGEARKKETNDDKRAKTNPQFSGDRRSSTLNVFDIAQLMWTD